MIRADEVTIPGYAHGYPEVAFGGYVAGMLAGRVGSPAVRVDFRSAIGVETPVLLAASGERRLLTDSAGGVLAEASPAEVGLEALDPPSWDRARSATQRALASSRRVPTDCYGCGELCEPGRGLRLFPGTVREQGMMAAGWVPDAGLALENGELPMEAVWSALDCPGGLAAIVLAGMQPGAFTAALTATQLQPVYAGVEYISYAWPVSQDGRKHTVGVALSTASGQLCALAEALWIERRGGTPADLWGVPRDGTSAASG